MGSTSELRRVPAGREPKRPRRPDVDQRQIGDHLGIDGELNL